MCAAACSAKRIISTAPIAKFGAISTFACGRPSAGRACASGAGSKPVVPITTCTPGAHAGQRVSERGVRAREVDDDVGAPAQHRSVERAICRAAGRRARPAPCPRRPSTASQTVWPMRPAAPATATRITARPRDARLRLDAARARAARSRRGNSPRPGRRPRRTGAPARTARAASSRTCSSVTASIRSIISSTERIGMLVQDRGAEAAHARARRLQRRAPRGP